MDRATITSLLTLAAATTALAEVPTYRVDVVATYDTTTTVRGASDAGHIVGDQIVLGVSLPYVATLDEGLEMLPLPSGYVSGAALDANDAGVIVGTVSTSSLAFDFGEPAVWTPNGAGGYTVQIPEQFETLPSPLGGDLAITGGQAVAINNGNQIVGWSRFQGFQGGPSTMFAVEGAPTNLSDEGFTALARDINDNGVVVGGGLRMDLATGEVTELGLPDAIQPGNVGFTDVIAFAVNDHEETVVAANLASVPTENYLTYTHNDADGYTLLNPNQFPLRFVGFYDNNDRGDVSASGAVYFKDEDALFQGYASLLEAGDSNWTVALGFIADDRRVFTTARDVAADVNAIVVLTPTGDAQPADLDGDGVVGPSDLGILIASWGGPDADLDGDGVVGSSDLGVLLAAWD